ncbi:MAG: YgjV family protein [Spirochaetaceae bacterium]|nr:YgjV family protein [Spirochaetaceae bacterium]
MNIDQKFVLEMIGYIGSAFVLISFLMASVIKLRIVNSIGSLFCILYGFLIHAYPTVLMNACLLLINCYYLVKLFRHREKFSVIKSAYSEDCTQFFINDNMEDIKLFFPDFAQVIEKANFVRLVFCQNQIVGLFAAVQAESGKLCVLLDYTVKQYRDYAVGYHLFEALKAEGFSRFEFRQKANNHAKYLNKMGFKNEGGVFIKEV